MEKIEDTIFKELLIPQNCEVFVKDKVLYLTKWNWNFLECEKFQLQALGFVSKNKAYSVYIFTNHPFCFTHGRGNERGQDNLLDFDPSTENNLAAPFHKIHRGGGLTFHFPGQWIFYPIKAISQKYTLDDHMCWLLKSVKDVLAKEFKVENVITAKKLMGIWVDKKKMASIGVGMKKFITLHGLALNLVYDKAVFEEVNKVNPCGLDSKVYVCLNQLKEGHDFNSIEKFHKKYIKSII